MGVLCWSLSIAAHDLWSHRQRLGGELSLPSLASQFALCAGTLFALLWPLAFSRQELRTRFTSAPASWAVCAFEATFLAAVLCYVQPYAKVGTTRLWLAAGLIVGAGSVVLRLAPRLPPALTQLSRCAVILFALSLDKWLSARTYPWLHLAAMICAAAAFLAVARPLAERAPRWLLGSCFIVATGLLVVTPLLPTRSMAARGYMFDGHSRLSVHAAAFGGLLEPSTRRGLQQQGLCTEPLANRETPATASSPATAPGADVLLLSIDALRWDRLHALAQLRRELGDAVQFAAALSPSPRTAFALTAVLRGRLARQVPVHNRGRHVAESATATLGEQLRQHGYRSVYVASHPYLHEEVGLARGFEPLVPQQQLVQERKKLRQDSTPAPSLLSAVLGAARATPGPLLAWAHVMEAHDPYRHGQTSGPDSAQGQLLAIQALDAQLAHFLRDFRRARSNRSLVVAVFADHGEEFNEHGGRYHATSVHAEQVRVPLLLGAPGLRASTITAPVSTAALPATIVDLLGIAPLASYTVPSLWPCIIRGECPHLVVSELRPFSMAGRLELTGYTDRHYRLIHDHLHQVSRVYDLQHDPYEHNDLAPSRPELVAQLLREARTFDAASCSSIAR